MNQAIRLKLFLMMVLQFFIWGAWLPLIFGYLPSLGFSPGEQAWILNAFPIAAIVGMFFSNQFADRNFSIRTIRGDRDSCRLDDVIREFTTLKGQQLPAINRQRSANRLGIKYTAATKGTP